MKPLKNAPALNFNAVTLDRKNFELNSVKGNKILLSFYNCTSCSLTYHRLKELKKHRKELLANNTVVVSVFESIPQNMIHFAEFNEPPFYTIADPMALLYELYGVEYNCKALKEPEIFTTVTLGLVMDKTINDTLDKSAYSHFLKLPKDLFIDQNFIVREAYDDKINSAEVMLKWIYNSEAVHIKRNLLFRILHSKQPVVF